MEGNPKPLPQRRLWVGSGQRPDEKVTYPAPSDYGGAPMDGVVIRTSNPWNKGKLVGQKAPFKLKEIWAIRVRLQIYARTLELALFDLGIDSKLSTLEEIGESEWRRVLGRTVRRHFGDSRRLWGGLESGDDSPIRRNPGHPKAIHGYVVGSRRTRTATFRGG